MAILRVFCAIAIQEESYTPDITAEAARHLCVQRSTVHSGAQHSPSESCLSDGELRTSSPVRRQELMRLDAGGRRAPSDGRSFRRRRSIRQDGGGRSKATKRSVA